MREHTDSELSGDRKQALNQAAKPIVIATMLREAGATGVQTHVTQLCRYLAAAGVENFLVTPFSWARPLTYPAFSVRFLLNIVSNSAGVTWYRFGHELFLYRALIRRLSSLDDCVVYAQGPLEARAALRARRGPHQRVVMVVHYKTSQADEWVDRKETPIKRGGRTYQRIRRDERETIPRVDGLVSVSEWARQAVLEWLPEAAHVPSAVIVNFTEPMVPEPNPESLADIVTTGSIEQVKNHTYLLDILAEANRRGHRYTLDIFGQGMLINELQEKARDLGLADQIRWRGFRPDVRNFLPGYRAYAHASYSESSSLAIIEAMAAGLPILAGKIGGVQELFDDGVEGRFWPLDNVSRATDMLIELLDSEDGRRTAGQAARKRYFCSYDSTVVAPRLLEFLQEE